MDGKDKIIEKILSDAENYRAEVVQKADEDYNVFVGSAASQAEKLLKEQETLFETEESEALKRKKVVAVLDGKKMYLSKKTQAVNDVFSNTLKRLNNLDKSAYKSLIARLIEKNAVKGATIVLSTNAPLDVSDVLGLDVVKSLDLKVRKDGNFSGGLIIESDISDVNLSFEAITQGLKERYESYVAEKLFD